MTDLQTGRRDRGDGDQARPEEPAADYPRDRRTAGQGQRGAIGAGRPLSRRSTTLLPGADNSYTLTMKPSVVRDIEQRALQQSIETIRERIDNLGVNEPVIEEYGPGTNEILVELPGIDDPGRVKDVIQSTARLEIHEVLGGPYPDRTERAAGQRRDVAAGF